MKTIYLIILLAYAVPALISALRLWFDKDTDSFKKYLRYCWWALCPVWNLVLTYFVILEIRDKFRKKKYKQTATLHVGVTAVLALRKRNFDEFVKTEGKPDITYVYIDSVDKAKGYLFNDVIYLFNWSGLKNAYKVELEVHKRLRSEKA